MIVCRTARNLTDAFAARVSELPETDQLSTVAALEDNQRRDGWLDRDAHEYVVSLDGDEFVCMPIDDVIA